MYIILLWDQMGKKVVLLYEFLGVIRADIKNCYSECDVSYVFVCRAHALPPRRPESAATQ